MPGNELVGVSLDSGRSPLVQLLLHQPCGEDSQGFSSHLKARVVSEPKKLPGALAGAEDEEQEGEEQIERAAWLLWKLICS